MLPCEIPSRRQVWLVFLTYLLISVLALPVLAENVSQLLEQGIYNEETVGDLDKAIEVYGQVLTESKDSIEAAAEAQYRIGDCYAKQGKQSEAQTAFQAVVDNYPSAQKWVDRAKSRLSQADELLPVPWGDGDELLMEMKLPNGLGVGLQVYRVGKVERDGKPYWQCDTWQAVTLNGLFGRSQVLADYETFAPIESFWRHTLLGSATAEYSPNQVVIKMASKDEPVEIELAATHYDNEQAAEAFRRLKLEQDAKLKMNIMPILTAAKLELPLKVSAVETITVPAGTFECYRMELEMIGQTFWISNDDHRYIVRFTGGGVTADLTEIRSYAPDKSRELQLEHLTMTLPPNWFSYTPSNPEDESGDKTMLIAPEEGYVATLRTKDLEVVRSKYATPQLWLEDQMGDDEDEMKGVNASPAQLDASPIADQPAARAEFTVEEGNRKTRILRVDLFGESAAVDLRFHVEDEKFAKLRAEIDQILASLQVK